MGGELLLWWVCDVGEIRGDGARRKGLDTACLKTPISISLLRQLFTRSLSKLNSWRPVSDSMSRACSFQMPVTQAIIKEEKDLKLDSLGEPI